MRLGECIVGPQVTGEKAEEQQPHSAGLLKPAARSVISPRITQAGLSLALTAPVSFNPMSEMGRSAEQCDGRAQPDGASERVPGDGHEGAAGSAGWLGAH